jgi:hypothetical protein
MRRSCKIPSAQPAAAGEPRSPRGAREAPLRAGRPPFPGAVIAAPGQRLRRGRDVARAAADHGILPYRIYHAFTAKGSPDLHDAKRSCHGTLGIKRSTTRRCRAVDPIVFLLRTIIPLFREPPAARGCFEAFPPLQPGSHRRRSREAGGRFPYRCRI